MNRVENILAVGEISPIATLLSNIVYCICIKMFLQAGKMLRAQERFVFMWQCSFLTFELMELLWNDKVTLSSRWLLCHKEKKENNLNDMRKIHKHLFTKFRTCLSLHLQEGYAKHYTEWSRVYFMVFYIVVMVSKTSNNANLSMPLNCMFCSFICEPDHGKRPQTDVNIHMIYI